MFRNSAANQLLKFAENRGQEINNLDRLLQAQMGLPMPAHGGQPSMTAPQQQPQPPQPQLLAAAPIQPAQFDRPWLTPVQPQQQPQQQQQSPQQQSPQQQTPQPQQPLAYSDNVPRPDWYEYRRDDNAPTLSYAKQIEETAHAIGTDPLDLATLISYETGGTFDPKQPGPTTQWGQHRGPIQFGETQALQYGVDWANPSDSQFGADGAIARYFRDRGFKPGMDFYGLYSTVNAGAPGLYSRSDANNGGAPGTVADKVESRQMQEHRRKAAAAMGYNVGQAGEAPAGATQRAYDRGQTVGVPQPQAPMSEEEYERRIASLEEMADQSTPRRMTNREQFSLSNFDLGGALRGFGLGLGQMSQGQAVDLGSVYNSQERRANTELDLALDRNRRTAASEMALEMGDEAAAAAIAQGGIDFSQFLTQRQMEQVEARAMRNEMRDEIGRNAIFDYLAPTLGEEGARAAMYNPSTVLGFAQIMEANRRAEVARSEQQHVFQGQLDAAHAALENPNVTPTTQWAAQQVINSGGQITLKDAMKMAGDDYDRFAPPDPPAPTTDMRNYEADMAGRPPEQQVPFGEWLDRNQGADQSAAEAEIARLQEANPNMSREEAIRVRDQYRVDPVAGGVIDTATGQRVAPQFRPTVAPIEGPRLYEQAELATGIGAAASAFGTNVGGQIPIARELFSDNNPNIMAARNIILSQNDLARALALNPKYPVGEIERIISEVGIQPGAFKSSQGLRAAMQVTDTYMRNKYFEELAIANDPTATRDEASAARQTAQSLARFIARLGVPNEDGTITPAGTVTLPKDEAAAEAAYNDLAPGDYFVSPDGKLRQKGN